MLYNATMISVFFFSIIGYSWGKKKKKYSLFDRPESGFVRAKKYLAGHHDRQPAVRFLQPC